MSLDLGPVTVGAADFYEQQVLGHLVVGVLDRFAHPSDGPVTTGGMHETRQALRSGSVDLWCDYTDIPDETTDLGRSQAEREREDRRAHDVIWLARSWFVNALAFATCPPMLDEIPRPLGVDSLVRWLADRPDVRVIHDMSPAVLARYRKAITHATGVLLDDEQLVPMAGDDPLDAVRGGAAACAVMSSTHPSGAAADVKVIWEPGVVDDHRAALCVRGEVYRRAPSLFEEVAAVSLGMLSRAEMAALNRAVAVDHHTAAAVADRYLGDLDG